MHVESEDDDGNLIALEVDPATEADDVRAAEAGLTLVREVLQLRRSLPLERSSTCHCRPFRPGLDDDDFLRINNLAFEWHPDQSGWSVENLNTRMQEPWFDPDGFLLLEDDGRVVAFCWTRVHPSTADEAALGEIFVIGVDPVAHGRGLGTEIVLAGLEHLTSFGITTGMLHVEAGNTAARHMYDRLGFTTHSAHRWWAVPGSPVPTAPAP